MMNYIVHTCSYFFISVTVNNRMEKKEKQKASGRVHFPQYIKHTTYILMDLEENALNITLH